jgi:cytochrome b6-f complex iron-sulfur subunit
MKITRKEFFLKSLKGAALIAVTPVIGTAIEGCKSSNPFGPGSGGSGSGLATINVSESNGTIILPIESSSPLAKTGSVALLQNSNYPVLVNRKNSDAFEAMSAICTHQGCLVSDYDSSKQEFICPCHGSRFSLTGQVDQGPAYYPLPQYQTQFQNNQLVIKVK